MNRAADAAIAWLAQKKGLIVVTKDQDFVVLQRPDNFAIVWLRCGNITNAALLELIQPQWTAVLTRLAAGVRLIEVR